MTSLPDAWLIAPAQLVAGEPRSSMGKMAGREEAALAALYAAHAATIQRFLSNLLGDPVAAADATQETFARAFRRLDTLQREERPLPWLFGIARNVSLELRRTRRTQRRFFVVDSSSESDERQDARTPEQEMLGREAAGVLHRALDRLSEERRTMLLLRLDHGLAYEDIARTMGFTVAKVKVEIFRARQVLREELQRYQGDPP